jgi:E3 ubiquitin-protein ligase RNF115/126
MNTIDIAYSTSTTRTYWCHLCKREFDKIYIENIEVQCRFCGNNFCEEITPDTTNDHPSVFEPYESPSTSNTNRNLLNMVHLPRQYRPRTSSSFLDMIINLLGVSNHDDSNMESIIHYIMQNDPNRYGNPPARKSTVEALERIECNEDNIKFLRKDSGCDNSCSVCKDEFEVNQKAIYLPCKHLYHESCILPWLKDRNSCPTCRFELPSEDPEYDSRKNI